MKKLILFILVLCTLVSCIEVPKESIYDVNTATGMYRYEIIDIIIRDHDYIYLDGYNEDNHLIHNPDCKKCQQDNKEDLFSW